MDHLDRLIEEILKTREIPITLNQLIIELEAKGFRFKSYDVPRYLATYLLRAGRPISQKVRNLGIGRGHTIFYWLSNRPQPTTWIRPKS